MDYLDTTKLYDDDIYGYLLINQQTGEILESNELAQEMYQKDDVMMELKDIFLDSELFFDELENFGGEKSIALTNLISINNKGEQFKCNLDICFVNPEKQLALLVIIDRLVMEDPEIQALLNLTGNPVLVLDVNDDFKITYASSYFYKIIRKTPVTFQQEYDGSFLKLVADPRRIPFSQVLEKQLELSQTIHLDVELSFEDELFQLYHLNGFRSYLDGKLYCVLISVKKQSDLMKKIEFDQQFFDIMQEFSKDLLFHIDIKKKTMLHRGDISNFVDLFPTIENYPESMRESRLVHPDDVECYIAYAYRLMSGLNAVCETRFQLRNGNYEKYKLQGKVLFDFNGNPIQVVGKSENIQKYVDIETRANYDSLTTTLNKQSFKELIKANIERSVQSDRFALLFLDFDNFKGVNDTMGHKFGDFLLEVAGKRIINAVRNHDKVGRVGGDEFVIFFQHAPNPDAVLERAISILHALRRPFNDGELSVTMKASIGIALYPLHGSTYDELYEHSDIALYRSKALGKDVATIYTPELKVEAQEAAIKKRRLQKEKEKMSGEN